MFYSHPGTGSFGKVARKLPYSNYFLCEEMATGIELATGKDIAVVATRIVYIGEMKDWILYTKKEAKRVILRARNGEQK
jgi:hypothetical protein